jgi:hypothetical protein
MATRNSSQSEGPPDRFDYFMVRVTRAEDDARLTGLVERLGTGEKRSFGSGQQLLWLVGSWSDAESNLQARAEASNPGDRSPADQR